MGKQTVEAASSKSFLMFAQQSIGCPLSSEKKQNKIEKSFNRIGLNLLNMFLYIKKYTSFKLDDNSVTFLEIN